MELGAYPRTINDLFSVNKKYIVPRFQREYSWEKEQYNELWKDITSNIHVINNQVTNGEYFIGPLVLVGVDTSTDFLIVDGQQRLTTLTILMSALVETFKQKNELGLANGLYKFIEGRDEDDKPFFKLVNENPKPFLQKSIQYKDKDNTKAPEGDEEKRLLASFNFFMDKLSEVNLSNDLQCLNDLSTSTESKYLQGLKAVRNQILRFLKVISITVKNEDDAYVIFETLNARGINLTTVDLVKNDIFKALKSTHPNDEAKTMWKKVRTNLSSREEVIPVNTFFRHFWLSKYGFTTEAKMYKKFKSSVKNGTIEAENFLKDLVTEAFNYSIVSSPLEIDWKQQEEIDIFDGLKALKIFKIKIVRTLLIALITQRTAKKIKLGDFNRVISAIEKFHFTHTAVCSERSTGLEAKYSKIARAVRDCSTKAESRIVLDDFIDYLKNKVPPYSLFKEKFKNVLYTKDKKLIQYIFTKWEQSIRQTNELTTKIITLEHIKPKSLGGKEVHQIGNLLPLDRKLNQDADTLPLHQKIIEFQKSELKVVEIFLSENNGQTTWNTSDISNRTTRIAHIAYHTIWKI